MKSRSVRVFLSSTFRDFGEERDLLVRKVFPALRAKLKDRFVELVDVDLRWGITVEQAERGEVLPICLAEIDRSRPYFIGLLGERYGWVPGADKYPSTLLRQRRWLKDHQGGKSVTELEILHGVLNAPEMAGRARFYFRSSAYAQKKRGEYLSVDKEDRKRQRALKARIRKSDFPVVRYVTPAELAKRLERDLWRILDAEFPAESTPDAFERESMRHEAYAAPRRRLYLGGDRYLKTLKALHRKNTPRILVTGQSGAGKSALLANALVGMHSAKVHLFEHYLGASSDSADAVSLVRRLIEYIRWVTQSTDDVPNDPQALFESLPTWLAIASAYAQKTRTRWVFVLDALNNLSSYQDLRWFPSYLPPRLSIVVSCLEGDVLAALEAKGPWERMTIDPLDRAGQERLLTAYLRRYNKTLPTDLQARTLDHPLAGNPLWLKTLAEELRLFGSHEELEQRLTTLLCHPKGKGSEEPLTVDDLFEHVLERIEHDHGQKLVRNALTSIWASRAGLSEPELLEILNCPPAIWAPIRYALDEMLLGSGGRILFAHDYAKIAVRDRYLSSEKKQQQAHRSLAKYFASKSVDSRVVEELPHQWREARAWGSLKNVLKTRSMFEATLRRSIPGDRVGRTDSMREYLGYWTALEVEFGRPLLETSMSRAWRSWQLAPDFENSVDLAHELATLIHTIAARPTSRFAFQLVEFALKSAEIHSGNVTPRLIRLRDRVAYLHYLNGDYKQAEKKQRIALSQAIAHFGHQHPAVGWSVQNLAIFLSAQDKHKEAEKCFFSALEICEETEKFGNKKYSEADFPFGDVMNSMGVCVNLANQYTLMLDFESAEKYAEKAVSSSQEKNDVEMTAHALSSLADVYFHREKYEAAERIYRRVLTLFKRSYGTRHPNIAAAYQDLAACLVKRGKRSEAVDVMKVSLDVIATNFGIDSAEAAEEYFLIGSNLQKIKRYDEARSNLDAALKIYETRDGRQSSNYLKVKESLGKLRVKRTRRKGGRFS